MIRAVIFDCFGVLYLDASRYFYEHLPLNDEGILAKLLDLNKAYDYGLITREEHTDAVAEITGVSREVVRQNIWDVHQRNDKLLEYTQTLRPTYKVGMCSNIGPGGMDTFFSDVERAQLFDTVVLSGEEGVTKPNPEIFRLTADRLGCLPHECVMIDDIEENCSGADAAGMASILYQTNGQVMRELREKLKDNE